MKNYLFDIAPLTDPNGYDLAAGDFQTPPHICKYMVSLLPDGIKAVLESTPGNGNLVAALSGYNITAPNDFVLLRPQRFDAVVMNPPFTVNECNMENAPTSYLKHREQLGYRLLLECMKFSDLVICLLPWFTLINSNKRVKHLQKFGLRSLTQVSRSAFPALRIQCVVIELDRMHRGDTVYKIID